MTRRRLSDSGRVARGKGLPCENFSALNPTRQSKEERTAVRHYEQSGSRAAATQARVARRLPLTSAAMAYLHQRRTLRLPARDYSRGTYLVTLCARDKGDVFGDVIGEEVRLNDVGHIVRDAWLWLPGRYPHVMLDEWILMPDHLHALIVLSGEPAPGSAGAPTAVAATLKPLGQLIGASKTVSTKYVNRARTTPGAVLWQRNFWERVARNNGSLDRLRLYIRNNPRALRTGGCWGGS